MEKLIGVKFKDVCKIVYCKDFSAELKYNDKLVVQTSRGLELANYINSYDKDKVGEQDEILTIVRVATNKDLDRLQKEYTKIDNIKKECNQLIEKYKLDMKVVDVNFTVDIQKVIISFTCEDRVDFRELVKELAIKLKQRIELRQIGIRDQAKIVGGIGCCGKECCCKQYLNDFEKVSIKMAKVQNLSLNPTKISGICGRLMCCLSYENEYYEQTNKIMPKVNSYVSTPEGKGNVVYNNLLKQLVTVKISLQDSDYKMVEYPLDQIKVISRNNNEK